MYTFDFEPVRELRAPNGVRVAGATATVFGCDATGGEYLWAQSSVEAYVLHVETRGVSRVLATSLPAAIRMIVELPYFRELLVEAGGAGLSQMRSSAERLEREVVADIGAIPEARAFIVKELGLPEVEDPIGELYRVGIDCPFIVTSEDGFEYLSELRQPNRRTA